MLALLAPSASRAETATNPSFNVEPVSSASEAYAAEVAAAVNEHRLGHFEEARAHFAKAHRLQPSARTLRGLGKVEFELRNYGECLRHLRASLSSNIKPLDPEMRLEVDRLIDRASVYTGEVHLEITPGTATVSVDGIVIARGPKASLSLDIGDHLLEFQATGRTPQRKAIHVRSGEATSLHIVLVTTSSELEGTTRLELKRDDSAPRSPQKRRIWIAASVTAVGAIAVGLAIGLTRRDRTTVESVHSSPNTPPGFSF